MFHPEYELLSADTAAGGADSLTPLYAVTEGLAQISLRKLIGRALDWAERNRGVLEHAGWEALFRAEGLPGFVEALRQLHEPGAGLRAEDVLAETYPPRQRLILEELLAYQLSFARLRGRAERRHAAPIAGGEELFGRLQAQLPFRLTAAQLRVIDEIRIDLARPRPMMRLLQGDVGSGKTLVAAAAALQAAAAGYQAALMAPTELLAEQHARNFRGWLEPLDVGFEFLAGSQSRREQQQAKQRLRAHRASVVVGTHALIQEDVAFDRLGLLIIDEQHRFGVHQRLALRRKGEGGELAPHQLIMTATPIPRSLAMTFYADLDHSLLDELPPGRLPVRTAAMSDRRRDELTARIRAACRDGQQAYWVCTLIEESEILQCEAAERTWETLRAALPELSVGLVHGRMKVPERERVMADFQAGRVQLLVATTVVEVGVDVPNASLMVIENAERLGLAQLHQLRGRVGRGRRQSSCVLLYKPPLSEHAQTRLQAMRDTADGFEIARRDLRLRGPGQLLGTRQAGEMVFRVADLSRDERQLRRVRGMARDFLQASPAEVDGILARWLGEARRFGAV